MTQQIRSIRRGDVTQFTISMNTNMTGMNMLVNTPIAPPGQNDVGAVARMIPPIANTPASSGVTRVIGCRRDRLMNVIAARPRIAAISATWTCCMPGI